MKKIFALILIMSIALSAITVEDAWDTAAKYKYSTENININPPIPINSGGIDYWIFEVSAYGAIKTMIPVDAETGEVNTEDSIIDGIEVHYLANFFATHSDIEDFLGDTISMAKSKKDLFESKKLEYESEFQPAITGAGINLNKESAYLNDLQNAKSSADSVMDKAVVLTSAIGKISSNSDVSDIQSGFSALFAEQKEFAKDLADVSTSTADLREEITEQMTNDPNFQTIGAQAKQSLSYPTLISDKNQLELDVETNQDVINTFFTGIDLNTEQYLLRLQERAAEIPDEELIEWINEKISTFTDDYTDIAITNAGQIDPQYDLDIQTFNSKLTEMQNLFSQQEYDEAKLLVFEIEDKITFLRSKIGTWPPDCSGGQYHDGTRCVCPTGQTLENGVCVNSQQDYEINWWLVGGLGFLIAALIIYRFKDKLFGAKQNDEDEELTDDNSFYSAFE